MKQSKSFKKKMYKKRNNKRTRKNLKLCVKGNTLGEQEDIFTLGQCKKLGGSGNISIPSKMDYWSPIPNTAPSIPGPIVGTPYYAGNLNELPGSNGVDGNNNYYPYNNYSPDIQLMVQNAGKNKKHNKHKRIKKGGGIFQGIQNFGRELAFNSGSLFNTFRGYPQPVNPLPYEGQLSKTYFQKNINY
jgi:hypothetical protein